MDFVKKVTNENKQAEKNAGKDYMPTTKYWSYVCVLKVGLVIIGLQKAWRAFGRVQELLMRLEWATYPLFNRFVTILVTLMITFILH